VGHNQGIKSKTVTHQPVRVGAARRMFLVWRKLEALSGIMQLRGKYGLPGRDSFRPRTGPAKQARQRGCCFDEVQRRWIVRDPPERFSAWPPACTSAG
jgi:hypothetical protein